ncbi:MAG TPA: cation:proton antiporter [Streptosporangiaceae bacterium]|nr:cation:proton antiporter [Streptosporangiaceae bacterium]
MSSAESTIAAPRESEAAVAPVRPSTRLPLATLTYAALVVVPVLLTLVFLRGGSGGGAAGPATGRPAYDPFAGLLIAVPVILVVCQLSGLVFRRLSQPAVVGEIFAGILLGPSVLGMLSPQAFGWLFPARLAPALSILAQLGLIFFMFLVGYELNLHLVRRRSRTAVLVSHASIALPLLFGTALALAAYPVLAPKGVGYPAFALFLATSMSVTAFPVLARILADRRMSGSPLGVTALTCAAIDDVTAWCLLSLVVALVRGGSPADAAVIGGLTLAFIGGMALVVRPLLARLLVVRAERHPALPDVAILPLLLGGTMLCAMATNAIGIHPIFGAFLFGAVVPRGSLPIEYATDRLHSLTTTLLLPLFFIYTGLRTQIGLLGTDPRLWAWCGLILVAAIAGKLLGGMLAARASGLGWRESASLGVLMNCRGLTELVVLNVGLDLHVITPTMFTMLVVMALVTTVLTGPGLRLVERGRSPAAS